MPETKKTFPRIEVRGRGLEFGPGAIAAYLFTQDGGDSYMSTKDLQDQLIAELRSRPEAGDCCPVYDYTEPTIKTQPTLSSDIADFEQRQARKAMGTVFPDGEDQ